MKALTLIQPWASAMRSGLKQIETRSWRTGHRGPLAIHAGAKKPVAAVMDTLSIEDVKTIKRHLDTSFMPRGAVLGVVDLVDVVTMSADDTGAVWYASFSDLVPRKPSPQERAWGAWADGRFAWITRPLVWLGRPIPCGGALGVWSWDAPQYVNDAVERARRDGVVVEVC